MKNPTQREQSIVKQRLAEVDRIKQRLIEITAEGSPHDGTASYIRTKIGYLSGIPYLWSSDVNRAFIFRDRAQAEELIRSFPLNLSGATVGAMNDLPSSY